MSDYFVDPDEIVAEIRKRYPTERIVSARAPRVTFANENLYGVPIYIYGEGIKGQYIRHGFFDRQDKRYWQIEYGWVSLYGITDDKKALPLVVLGVPTRFVFQVKPSDFISFKLEEIPLGYMEVLERQIINLSRALQAKDPMLIIDKYDLLRGNVVPSEFIDRIIEQNSLIETLQRTLWEYEKVISDYKSNIAMLEARNAKLHELLRGYEERIIKLSTEVTSVQNELLRLREEILVRSAEAESLESTRRRLRDLIDDLTNTVEDIVDWASSLKAKLPKEEKGK